MLRLTEIQPLLLGAHDLECCATSTNDCTTAGSKCVALRRR